MRRHYPAGLTTQQGGALTMMIMALFFGGLLTLAIKIGPACNATAAALIPEGSGAQWTHLEAEQGSAEVEGGDTVAAPVGWRGVVEPSAGPLRLAVRLPPDQKQFQHVLEWQVL